MPSVLGYDMAMMFTPLETVAVLTG